MLLGTLEASLLGNMLIGKVVVRASEGVIRAGQDFNATSFLTNFVIEKYYQNEPRFIWVYSSNNLPKIKDGVYVINLDEYKSVGTHLIA